MKILVIGSGGREHALCWKLAQSPGVEVLAAPGNPGIAQVATCVPVTTGASYAQIAESIQAELTVVGPEAPLVAGIVDDFRARGLKIVGPDRNAAQLEGSKVFAKKFFTRTGIPTAEFVAVESAEDVKHAVGRFGFPIVLKSDGLAAGKGVVIVHDRSQVAPAIATLPGPLVIEEFLHGEEVSFIALCDGRDAIPLAPTQDHKAAFDGDRGPNTGGMGAYCDPGILTSDQTELILDRIIRRTVEETRFTGFLYAGLMMTHAGPKVLEFNVRLGDPETQPLMHRMQSDFVPALLAAAEGQLHGTTLEWRSGPSVCVVMASARYPGEYETGKPITGIDAAEFTGATVFQAGTRLLHGHLETAGGRVLGVTASGADMKSAIDAAYAGVAKIDFEGKHYRKDIGHRALARYNQNILGT